MKTLPKGNRPRRPWPTRLTETSAAIASSGGAASRRCRRDPSGAAAPSQWRSGVRPSSRAHRQPDAGLLCGDHEGGEQRPARMRSRRDRRSGANSSSASARTSSGVKMSGMSCEANHGSAVAQGQRGDEGHQPPSRTAGSRTSPHEMQRVARRAAPARRWPARWSASGAAGARTGCRRPAGPSRDSGARPATGRCRCRRTRSGSRSTTPARAAGRRTAGSARRDPVVPPVPVAATMRRCAPSPHGGREGMKKCFMRRMRFRLWPAGRARGADLPPVRPGAGCVAFCCELR